MSHTKDRHDSENCASCQIGDAQAEAIHWKLRAERAEAALAGVRNPAAIPDLIEKVREQIPPCEHLVSAAAWYCGKPSEYYIAEGGLLEPDYHYFCSEHKKIAERESDEEARRSRHWAFLALAALDQEKPKEGE